MQRVLAGSVRRSLPRAVAQQQVSARRATRGGREEGRWNGELTGRVVAACEGVREELFRRGLPGV